MASHVPKKIILITFVHLCYVWQAIYIKSENSIYPTPDLPLVTYRYISTIKDPDIRHIEVIVSVQISPPSSHPSISVGFSWMTSFNIGEVLLISWYIFLLIETTAGLCITMCLISSGMNISHRVHVRLLYGLPFSL